MFVTELYAQTQAPSQQIPGCAGKGDGSPQPPNFLFLAAMIAIFYFFLIRPQQKKNKEQVNFLDNLKTGAHVVTAGGIHGKITAVFDHYVILEVADKVRIKVTKAQIAGESFLHKAKEEDILAKTADKNE